MDHDTDPFTLDVAVIGGGISGLATAYHLLTERPALRVAVLEGAARAGGKIVSEQVDGFVIEGGPDSLLVQKPEGIALCRALGLGDRLIPTDPAYRRTFVLAGDRLHRIPEGLQLIVPTRAGPLLRSGLLSPWGKLRMAADLLLPRRRAGGDESQAAFVRRRLGREALDRLGDPIMSGIYVGDPARLSMAATFPQYLAMERESRSLILAARARARQAAAAAGSAPPASAFLSLQGGMGELVTALLDRLGPVVQTGAAVTCLQRADSGYDLDLGDGRRLRARQVVLAIPAHAAADLVAPFASELAAGLRAIPYAGSATISLGYRAADIAAPLDGSGFVVPATEPRPLLACTWTSHKFTHRAPADRHLIRAFVGGVRDEARMALSEADLLALVRAEFRRSLGIQAEPLVARIYRWPAGNPQYAVGHLDHVARLEALAAALPGLHLTGSPYRGVGIPDCVRAAQATAARVLGSRQ
jgi:oxygen-dependent protoporphyrinogen oxidase